MSVTVKAYEYQEWAKYGLEEYEKFSDKTTDCNIETYGDDTTSGTWFYIPDEMLAYVDPDVEEGKPTHRVIYHGTWGNYNSPGASHYTYAEVFDMSDEKDEAAYEAFKEELENADEYVEHDDEGWTEDADDDEQEEDKEAWKYCAYADQAKCWGSVGACSKCNKQVCMEHSTIHVEALLCKQCE